MGILLPWSVPFICFAKFACGRYYHQFPIADMLPRFDINSGSRGKKVRYIRLDSTGSKIDKLTF